MCTGGHAMNVNKRVGDYCIGRILSYLCPSSMDIDTRPENMTSYSFQ